MSEPIEREARAIVDDAIKRLSPEDGAAVVDHMRKAAYYEIDARHQPEQAEHYRRLAQAERGSAHDILAREARQRQDSIKDRLLGFVVAVLTGRVL